jgi:hypothetical protein
VFVHICNTYAYTAYVFVCELVREGIGSAIFVIFGPRIRV